MAKKPAPKKKPKKIDPQGPLCPGCGGPCDVSQRACDDAPKSRCMNEQCPKYGEPIA